MKNNMGIMLIVGIVVGAAISAMIFTMFNAGMPTGAVVTSYNDRIDINTAGRAIQAISSSSEAVYASGSVAGIKGETSGTGASSAVFGNVATTTSPATGVLGTSTAGVGTKGSSTNNDGVYGISTNKNGVYGKSGGGSTANRAGVYGESTASAYGLYGVSQSGIGVYGETKAISLYSAAFFGGKGLYCNQKVQADKGFVTKDTAGAVKTGVSGTFTTTDGKIITIVNGIITGIVLPPAGTRVSPTI